MVRADWQAPDRDGSGLAVAFPLRGRWEGREDPDRVLESDWLVVRAEVKLNPLPQHGRDSGAAGLGVGAQRLVQVVGQPDRGGDEGLPGRLFLLGQVGDDRFLSRRRLDVCQRSIERTAPDLPGLFG
jgi:hypothetical protein